MSSNWFIKSGRPPRWVIWLGGWLSLVERVEDLERRVAELERKQWHHDHNNQAMARPSK